MIRQLVLLGATGDLAGRYVLPALASLEVAGRLPDDLCVRAVDRGELDTDGYRRFAAGRLDRHAPDLPAAARTALVGRIDHARADVTSAEQTRAALADLPRPLAAYLALPPAVYAATIRALVAAGLGEGAGWSWRSRSGGGGRRPPS